MGKPREESLAFGGQALIEGVMIRGKRHLVMSVRQPSGEILTQTQEINSLTQRHRALGLPFIRGIIALGETMYMGVKGIAFSANAALEEEEEEFTWKEWAIVIVLTVAMSSLFFVIPFLVTSLLNLTGILFNLVEATVRLALFLGYMTLISLWGEFKRVLQYHGAEHKAINAHEHGVDLDVESVRDHSRLHRRCGTSFIFIVIIVSVLLFSIMPRAEFWPRLAYRIVLIPVLGAISYELLRFSAKHEDSIVIRLLTAPGVFFQHLTTKEPEDPMLEVAIEAVKEVIRLSSSTGT
ncbi:DUF1385 domain-containing protein [Candidatus Bathyarchaeota archaeon]|nr:DUF1385 domain-containing protein [Candidatus Bathyarchaeota archaeon]